MRQLGCWRVELKMFSNWINIMFIAWYLSWTCFSAAYFVAIDYNLRNSLRNFCNVESCVNITQTMTQIFSRVITLRWQMVQFPGPAINWSESISTRRLKSWAFCRRHRKCDFYAPRTWEHRIFSSVAPSAKSPYRLKTIIADWSIQLSSPHMIINQTLSLSRFGSN